MFGQSAHANAEETLSLIARRRRWLTCCRRHRRFLGRAAYVPDIRVGGGDGDGEHRPDPTWDWSRRCDCPASYFSNSFGNQAHLRQTTAEGRNVHLGAGSIRDLVATVETHCRPGVRSCYCWNRLSPTAWRSLIVMSDRRLRESVLDKRRCSWRRRSRPWERTRLGVNVNVPLAIMSAVFKHKDIAGHFLYTKESTAIVASF